MTKPFMNKEGEKYGDFSLINYQPIHELKAILRQLVHLPSGAQVMHIENKDPENVFCLSFKTFPDSSNGAPHILEHTVLCGSRKFPVKDPFFSMARRSLNTYMNALTGADFTCFPAATQIEKDFYNLLEVYLDAVFHPLLKEESFLQEGHRLEFQQPLDPSTPLEFKGIVYNEMKGALSSVDSRIWQAMAKELVPDLTYAHNSGGDPREIPNLSYAQLINFHETFYHPSRCLFYFYGNFPLKKHLDFIEKHALHKATVQPSFKGIGMQKRFTSPKTLSLPYPTIEEENSENKHLHAFGWLTTPLLNSDVVLALIVLDSILMDTDASPLKKALLGTGLCIHADSYLDVEMTEVPHLFLFRECQENPEPIEHALLQELKKIVKEGIPYSLVESSIHQLELSRTEIGGGSSPFGLVLFMRSALAMQHGASPGQSLQVHALFEEILEKGKDPFFFSPFIEKYYLHNPHRVRISFYPDANLQSQEAEEEQRRLESIKNSLTDKEITKLLDQAIRLKKHQEQQEETNLDCLPKVTLADIPAETRHFRLMENQRRDLKIFHHETFTNKILYSELFFDLPNLHEEELFYLQMLIAFWPELGVGKETYEQTLEFLQAYTGGIGAHMSLHVQAHDPMLANPSLQIHGKALERNMSKLLRHFEAMLTTPRFDEQDRIQELLLKLSSGLQSQLSRTAMRYATQLALSGFSTPSYVNQVCHGLNFYNKVIKLAKHPKKGAKQLMERFAFLQEKVLCAGAPHLVLCCENELFQKLDKADFYNLPKLTSTPYEPWKNDFTIPRVKNQARVIASPVAFTVQGFKTVHYAHSDAPALQVATLLLDNKILHRRIREQGGAYGSGANYNPLWGNFYLYAYRDPHIAHTLHTFRDGIHEISDGNFNRQDLEEAKMGIIQHFDTPVSPGNQAMVAYVWNRDGKTRQMRQNFRDRLLHLSIEDVTDAMKAHLLPQVNEAVVVTFAGKELLDKELPHMEEKQLEVFSIN